MKHHALSGATVLLAVCLCLPVESSRAADFYVEGGVGMSQFQRTVPDGTWVQEGTGPHKFHWQDLAYRAGLGINLTPQWSLGANMVNLGTVGSETFVVGDESYDPINHKCLTGCAEAKDARIYDTLIGGELVATYRPWLWAVAPFIRFGAAGFRHQLYYTVLMPDGSLPGDRFAGIMVAVVGGAGVCYVEMVCLDVSYYKGFTTTKFPVSTGVIVPMLTVKIPF